jgi:2'-5' RNA ligase
MPEGIRSFVAIKLSAELVAAIRDVQRQLERRIPLGAVRWSKPEQLHLTLKFLGNVVPDRLAQLEEALKPCADGLRPLRLTLVGAGCFPSPANPRVLWVGLGGDVAQLKELQQRVDTAASGFGDHEERREFHPHLTLGRLAARDQRSGPEVGRQVQALNLGTLEEWMADHFFLVQSELAPSGARYSDLAAFALKAG